MVVQHTKWLEKAHELPWRKPVPSLNILLTSTCWRNDHNGFSHQGPGLIDTVLAMKGTVGRIYLPPDANCLLSVADHCFRSRNYVNLIVIDKQTQLQWLDMDAAVKHLTAGASVWPWASNDQEGDPDVVLASAGDIPTLEVVAAAWLLRKHGLSLNVRGGQRRGPDVPATRRHSSARPGGGEVYRTLHGGQSGRLCLSRLPTGGPRDHPRAYFTYHGGVPFLPTASFNLLRENRCGSARTIQMADEQDAPSADGVAADVEGALTQVDPLLIERP